jgi:hypothetical protein
MATPNRADRGAGRTDPGGLTPSQWLALAVSIVFTLVGIAGFFVTGFDDFAAHDTNEQLLGFEVNPLHNLVHLALGLVGLALLWKVRGAFTYGVIVAVAYAGAFLYGLVALGKDWDILSLNTADNWLHLVLALVGAGLAALAYRDLQEIRGERAGRSTGMRTGRRDTAPGLG